MSENSSSDAPVKDTSSAEPEAAENMHEAASRLKAPPVESFFDGQVHFGAVDPEIIGDIAAP